MSAIPIIIYGLPGSDVLSSVASHITEDVFVNEPEAMAVLSEMMLKTMYANNGVGLAAPQIGISLRAIVLDTGHAGQHTEESPYGGGYAVGSLTLINPEIIEFSKEILEVEESCLSLPTLNINIARPNNILVRYQTIAGEIIEERFTGFLAGIVQHEIDHLNGITLLKYASRLKKDLFKKKIAKESKKFIGRKS